MTLKELKLNYQQLLNSVSYEHLIKKIWKVEKITLYTRKVSTRWKSVSIIKSPGWKIVGYKLYLLYWVENKFNILYSRTLIQ